MQLTELNTKEYSDRKCIIQGIHQIFNQTMRASEICRKAIALYGKESQKLLAVEECSELINALMKERRGRVYDDDIITEIADVQIMAEQLSQIYGRRKVTLERIRKLRRLESRMKRNGNGLFG